MSTQDLTDKLAAMIGDLQGHIERRAREIAEPRITEAHETAQAVVDDIMATAAAEERRLTDLVAELRCRLDAQVRRAERAEAKRDHDGVHIPGEAFDLLVEVARYVSAGRRFVDVEPYPDATARRALGALPADETEDRDGS